MINPWDVVSWIAAISVAALLISFTVAVIRTMMSQPRYKRKDERSTRIM